MVENKWGLTDEEVEEEIERLNATEAVKLARREQRIKYRRRQKLYTMRALEKRGLEMMAAGITREMLEAMFAEDEDGESGIS